MGRRPSVSKLSVMQVVFVADFFSDQILGGAESNDSVLISYLESNNFNVVKKHSAHCTLQALQAYKDEFFIISNFVGLSEASKKYISENCNYIIYEHDHKYVATRDPSKFKNFDIPSEQVVNYNFYNKAKKVIVLSQICKDVIEKNLNLNNVISIGTSLWFKDKFSFLRSSIPNQKSKKLGIINSANTIKGTQQAVNYCTQNNIDYELIQAAKPEDFLLEIAKYEQILFMPQVLETFCRVIAEAKVLNCKILTTPKLIGFFSEEKLVELNGENLLDQLVKRTDDACRLFKNIIDQSKEKITVILNCYRRPEYLAEQIQAIKNQSVQPTEIWVWVNNHKDNESYDFDALDVDRVFNNSYNWKYYGRFAAAMLAKTKYVAFFDDDTIPGNKWFENCISCMQEEEGIMGGAGVILKNKKYQGHDRFGWSSKNVNKVKVDLVGHAWFFKKDWLKYVWMEDPLTWDNGEDIHFAYTAQKHGNIPSFCPPHPPGHPELHSSLKGYKYGVDDKASSAVRNHNVFYQERDEIVAHSIKNGWDIISVKKE